MKHLGTILGACIAGMFVMSVWGAFAGAYGIAGGWVAGFMIISPMWFLNHFMGMIHNDGAAVDMAAGISVVGTSRDVFSNGMDALVSSLPTLGVVILGGITGGAVAYAMEQYLAKRDAAAKEGKAAA